VRHGDLSLSWTRFRGYQSTDAGANTAVVWRCDSAQENREMANAAASRVLKKPPEVHNFVRIE
jgi:hypothetical protein